MTQRGKPESFPSHSAAFNKPVAGSGAPVFPGKPTGVNLAVQRSLHEVFDEFSEIIAGELKSLSAEEFERVSGQDAP